MTPIDHINEVYNWVNEDVPNRAMIAVAAEFKDGRHLMSYQMNGNRENLLKMFLSVVRR